MSKLVELFGIAPFLVVWVGLGLLVMPVATWAIVQHLRSLRLDPRILRRLGAKNRRAAADLEQALTDCRARYATIDRE